MFAKKHEQSNIRAIRMPKSMIDFLKVITDRKEEVTANDFVVNLISASDEYKKFMRSYDKDHQSASLFN